MNEKPEKIRHIFAQNIKKRREKLGLSQEKLAESTGLSVQTINTIEGCRMWVSDKTISYLAKALKIEVFQLFIPYQEEKIPQSTASVLLELRQKILNDTDNFYTQIDLRFNEALKNSPQRQNDEETEIDRKIIKKEKTANLKTRIHK
jgi:transcriptional regulator with XRE-family HTH domain